MKYLVGFILGIVTAALMSCRDPSTLPWAAHDHEIISNQMADMELHLAGRLEVQQKLLEKIEKRTKILAQ